ncbi:MAG: transcriptional regulator FtrA [Paracoccaceae bacterium]
MPIDQHDSENRSDTPLVCLLAYDGLCAFEYGIGLEVFGLPRPEFKQWYELATIAAEPGPLRAMGGIQVVADGELNLLSQANVILVPGWRNPDAPVPIELIEALRMAHGNGARIASICSGAFVLAATGLLDGKRATTHWRYAEILAQKYPTIQVDPDVLYIEEGSVLTSAGSAAGLDLCLHIVRQDFGAAVANAVAKRLVLPAHRDGGQQQFLTAPVAHEHGGRIAPVLDQMRKHPDQDWPIARMCDAAGLTRRTFARKFFEATGQTPLVWLIATRVSHATDLLETSHLPLNEVAKRSGFGNGETFRREFRKLRGTSPSNYRKMFRPA